MNLKPLYKKDIPGQWYMETYTLLKDKPKRLTFADIAEATGIEAAWIRSFSSGRILDPSVNRIEALNAFLKKLRKA